MRATSPPEPHYGTGVLDYWKVPWYESIRCRWHWDMTFPECTHVCEGKAETVEACIQMARSADTTHAMHHARLDQLMKFPGRIRPE